MGADYKGVWFHLVGTESSKPKQFLHLAITELLDEFQEIFKELTCFPPPRSHEQNITLQERAKPVCVRPYMHPYYQKEEIEKLVWEMLTSGIISPNQSHYKEGRWELENVCGLPCTQQRHHQR